MSVIQLLCKLPVLAEVMEETKAVTGDSGDTDYCRRKSDPGPESEEGKAGKATPEGSMYVLCASFICIQYVVVCGRRSNILEGIGDSQVGRRQRG